MFPQISVNTLTDLGTKFKPVKVDLKFFLGAKTGPHQTSGGPLSFYKLSPAPGNVKKHKTQNGGFLIKEPRLNSNLFFFAQIFSPNH